MAAPAPPPHLILLPSLGVGHIIPFTELAKKLAARGFLISFVVTPHGLPIARNKIADAANIHIVELHLSEEIKPEVINHTSVDASDQIMPVFILNDTLLQDAFNNLLFSDLLDPPPLCIVTDFLLSWTVTMATKLGIPRVNVECSPIYSRNLGEVLWSRLPRDLERTSSGSYIVPHDAKITLVSRSHMPSIACDWDETHSMHKYWGELIRLTRQSWMTVGNTFYELEGDHVDEFQKLYAGPVRPIGPLLPDSFLSGKYLTTPTARLAAAEVDWLDHRTPGSVVYVSFGSQSLISSSQIIELALGLEASGKPFLWVLKLPDSDENKPDLDDFYRRTEQQGLILSGWTDQLAILSHLSVAAFITHCGWNSALEAISMGVPLSSVGHCSDEDDMHDEHVNEIFMHWSFEEIRYYSNPMLQRIDDEKSTTKYNMWQQPTFLEDVQDMLRQPGTLKDLHQRINKLTSTRFGFLLLFFQIL